MTHKLQVLAVAALFAFGVACETGRRSSTGFRLPQTASIERGKTAFVAFGCHSCHQVSGVDLPRHPNPAATQVALGGEISDAVSDGFLVTSIIYPAYHREGKAAAHAQMPDFDAQMTVQQLNEIVEFIQSTYKVRRPMPAYMYK